MELEDSSSPDEKDFPGLFERNSSKSKKGSEESDQATSEILPGKKLESKKDKKSKEKKDRQSYEALGGESEEEDQETKLFRSPSKSKKLKTFKFPSKKEKREKSREPDLKDVPDGAVCSLKDKKSKEEQKAEKKKAKKEKEKDKDKKSKSSSFTSNEVYEIGGERKFTEFSPFQIIPYLHFLQISNQFSESLWDLRWSDRDVMTKLNSLWSSGIASTSFKNMG